MSFPKPWADTYLTLAAGHRGGYRIPYSGILRYPLEVRRPTKVSCCFVAHRTGIFSYQRNGGTNVSPLYFLIGNALVDSHSDRNAGEKAEDCCNNGRYLGNIPDWLSAGCCGGILRS